jgi:hypothetical protein
MDTINEVALKERQSLGQLVHFRVVKVDGTYQLLCRFMWQHGELRLITQRKKARTWASLDSLYDYIDKIFGPVPTVFLLNFSESDVNAIATEEQEPFEPPDGGCAFT